MIAPADDLLGHRSPEPFANDPFRAGAGAGADVSDTAQSIFTERYWYMGAPVPAGDCVFSAGLGYYPNRGVVDGYAGLTIRGRQHVFCASRRADGEGLGAEVGPLRIEIEEPWRVHRIVLGRNPSGLSLDLRFIAALAPNDEGRDRVARQGVAVADVSRYVQHGRYEGWIDLGGQRLDVNRRTWWGARDRSWGLRVEPRTDESAPPLTRFRPMLFLWVCAQFEDHAFHLFLKEDAPGRPRSFVGDQVFTSGAPARRIESVEHALEWRADSFAQRVASGELRLRFADGARSTLRLRVLPGWFSLKAGLYGGFEGWFQGDDRGPLHTAARDWDLHDPEVRRSLRTLADQAAEFRDGEATGYGTVQAGVSQGYGAYPEIQRQPFM